MTLILLLAALAAALSCGCASAIRKDEDIPIMHMVLLQFTLDGDNPYEFATYAPQFAASLQQILSKDSEFEHVNAVVLGVGKTDCGISVVAVIEYIKNQTHSIYLDTESIVQHIVDLIEGNMNVFEEIYTMQNVRSVDVDKTNIRFLSHKSGIASTQIVVGTVAGILVLLGVAAMVVWMVVYKLKKKGYEKVPLLADESSDKNRWLKIPRSKRSKDGVDGI